MNTSKPASGRTISSRHLVEAELTPFLDCYPNLTFDQASLRVLRQAPIPEPLPTPAPQPEHHVIPGPPEHPELKVIVVKPSPAVSQCPALLHIHGGGYVVGSPEGSVRILQDYAMQARCVVISVDYRLAPETVYPGALQDNLSALRWVHANAAVLGVDPARIAVGGESAGGGHAAALAIAVRDSGGPPIAFQCLIYPMLDDRTGSDAPVSPFVGEFVWTAERNRFGWTSLLGLPAGSPEVPVGAVPARVRNLASLPPTFIAIGSLDLFVNENLDYASRLISAGVPVELHVEPGAFHGFDILVPDARVSRRFRTRIASALKRAFDRSSGLDSSSQT